MADFGLVTIPTHYTIQPADLARWAEESGFESLFFGEHSHIPTSRKTPFPLGGELPMYYSEFYDPFGRLDRGCGGDPYAQDRDLGLSGAGAQPD